MVALNGRIPRSCPIASSRPKSDDATRPTTIAYRMFESPAERMGTLFNRLITYIGTTTRLAKSWLLLHGHGEHPGGPPKSRNGDPARFGRHGASAKSRLP